MLKQSISIFPSVVTGQRLQHSHESIKNPGKRCRPDFRRALKLVFISATITLVGCASMPTTDGIKSGLKKAQTSVTGTVSSGFQKLKTKGPSSQSRDTNSSRIVFAQYPPDEIPHTLMKKPVADGRLTSGHGYRLSPTGVPIPRKHKGVDYAAPPGTPIYAAGDGVIEKLYVSKSYGNYIRIEHENNFFTAYAHMQAFADGLKVGSAVSKGQMIGAVGSTGRSSGPHLHFELIQKGTFLDPLYVYEPETQQVAGNPGVE